MVTSGLPGLRPDFTWEWDSVELPDGPTDGRHSPSSPLSSPVQPPRRPPPMVSGVHETIQRTAYRNLSDKVLFGNPDVGPYVEPTSTTQRWHQQVTGGSMQQAFQARTADLEAVEQRARKQAAENALAAKRLKRREAEVTAVEERAKQTMADLAKQNMIAKRKESELQHREELALAREVQVHRKSQLALESHAIVVEKEKRFEAVVRKTKDAIRREEKDRLEQEEETQEELAQMREDTRQELAKKQQDADNILMEKIRKLERQREANRKELADNLGDQGAYLERAKAELADREAEFAVSVARRDAQMAARENEFGEWEDQLHAQQQQQLAERWELLRFRDDVQKRIGLLAMQSEVLVRQEQANLLESAFTRWRALSVEALVQMKLSQLDFPSEDMSFVNPERYELRKPVAWVINPMNSAAKRDDERERRQDVLESHTQQQEDILMSSIFFIWRGVVLKQHRSQQSRRREEKARLVREELPRGVAWEVKGLQTGKWEAEQAKETMETRQNGGDQHDLHTVFFLWKHILRDPRKVSGHQRNERVKAPEEDAARPVAWSINTTTWPTAAPEDLLPDSASLEQNEDSHGQPFWSPGGDDDMWTPSPRAVGNRGKPFNHPGQAPQAAPRKLQVVRLSKMDLDATPERATERSALGMQSTTGLDTTMARSSPSGSISRDRPSLSGLGSTMGQKVLRGDSPLPEFDATAIGADDTLIATDLDHTMLRRLSGGASNGRLSAQDVKRSSRTPSQLSSLSRSTRSSKNGGNFAA